MKTYPLNKGVFSIVNMKDKINPKPQYQRGEVWSLDKKQQLIDTILRGYDIPKFYLRNVDDGGYEYEVVDGQQRLRAIWGYVDNQYPLGEYSEDLPSEGNLGNKYFKDLTTAQQEKILAFELSVTEIHKASEIDIRELFLRLQKGESLNPAEKRNAMIGNMRDFIAEKVSHKVFKSINMDNKRFKHDDWLAHVVCLELAGGATDIKAKDLQKMYEKELDFDKEGKIAKKVTKVLNYMIKVLNEDTPEMNIKWGFVDLYYLISNLIEEYDISDKYDVFREFYIEFELERRGIQDPAELLSKPKNVDWDKDMYDYITAFVKDGNKRKNLEYRHKVYMNRFLAKEKGLVPKDSKRAFTNQERIVIWRLAKGVCGKCNKVIHLDEMHADHIIPHSKGGITQVKNAQCLCEECNLKKSNKVD